jgi:dTDP-4-dehydrorhamnose 3,5-epimerase
MIVTPTAIPDLLLIEPQVFGDARGFFFESFHEQKFTAATSIRTSFVQDNHSRSSRGVLRGLHYQIQQPQAKLVRVVRGAVFDVAVDIRQSSPTFGWAVGLELSETNHRQLYVPAGFAHGFLALTDTADFLYKTSDYYAPQHERAVAWNDPSLIWKTETWPTLDVPLTLNAKDLAAPLLSAAEVF